MANFELGDHIEVLTSNNLRYTGVLFDVDPNESAILLINVQSHGTEGRDAPIYIPASGVFATMRIYVFEIESGRVIRNHDPALPPNGAANNWLNSLSIPTTPESTAPPSPTSLINISPASPSVLSSVSSESLIE